MQFNATNMQFNTANNSIYTNTTTWTHLSRATTIGRSGSPTVCPSRATIRPWQARPAIDSTFRVEVPTANNFSMDMRAAGLQGAWSQKKKAVGTSQQWPPCVAEVRWIRELEEICALHGWKATTKAFSDRRGGSMGYYASCFLHLAAGGRSFEHKSELVFRFSHATLAQEWAAKETIAIISFAAKTLVGAAHLSPHVLMQAELQLRLAEQEFRGWQRDTWKDEENWRRSYHGGRRKVTSRLSPYTFWFRQARLLPTALNNVGVALQPLDAYETFSSVHGPAQAPNSDFFHGDQFATSFVSAANTQLSTYPGRALEWDGWNGRY